MTDDRPSASTRPPDVASAAKTSEPWRNQVKFKLDLVAAPNRLRRIALEHCPQDPSERYRHK